MDRVYRSKFLAEFTSQVYRKTLLVLFTGLIYLLSFVLLFEPSLPIGFTHRVLHRQTFYEVEFYLDCRRYVFGLSFQSNIWIDYTCCVYG